MSDVGVQLNVFAREPRDVEIVRSCSRAIELFSNPENALICVDKKTKTAFSLSQGPHKLPEKVAFSRVLILFTELPVKTETIASWKEWVLKNKIPEYKMDFLRIGEFTADYVGGRIQRHCSNWDREKPKQEDDPDERWTRIGALLDMSGSNAENASNTKESGFVEKDSPDLLTASFGSMGELMLRIHDVVSRFETMKKSIHGIDFAKRQSDIAKQLKFGGDNSKDAAEDKLPTSFPKLLLYGETGVGKSLVSRYLHKQISNTGRPLRISIPEFVGKEESLEYALFGYARGAYTGGAQNGSTGLLIENMGKVVFLDEIQEANNTIQAKLLAFMDDYRVRPRGWLYESFYCPVLIVAATNCSETELRKRFRKDLMARFTDVETIPPLRERKESMDFIIDCLLQQESINAEKRVSHIGRNALAKLKGYSYEKGNFRELEDVLRNACTVARKDGRDYLCECDIVFD